MLPIDLMADKESEHIIYFPLLFLISLMTSKMALISAESMEE